MENAGASIDNEDKKELAGKVAECDDLDENREPEDKLDEPNGLDEASNASGSSVR